MEDGKPYTLELLFQEFGVNALDPACILEETDEGREPIIVPYLQTLMSVEEWYNLPNEKHLFIMDAFLTHLSTDRVDPLKDILEEFK
jgi:hypothetical protein